MKKNLQRLLALVLAVTFVFGGSLTVSAANEGTNSTTDANVADIREQLNADSYETYLSENANVPDATSTIVIPGVSGESDDENVNLSTIVRDGVEMLYTPSTATVRWKVNIPTTAKYSIIIEYMPNDGEDAKISAIERIFKIDGKSPFKQARYITLPKTWVNQYPCAKVEATKDASIAKIHEEAIAAGFTTAQPVTEKGVTYVQLEIPKVWTAAAAEFVSKYEVRFFVADVDKNEIRPSMKQDHVIGTYELRDADGAYAESYQFVFEAGERTISLEGVNEGMAIKSIMLVPHNYLQSYDEYLKKFEGIGSGMDTILLQAEYMGAMSSQTI